MDTDAELKSYLFTANKYACFSRIKEQKRLVKEPDRDTEPRKTTPAWDNASGSSLREPASVDPLVVKALDECLKKLPRDRRMCVLLNCIERTTLKETRDIVYGPSGPVLATIRTRIIEARAKLRRCLERKGITNVEDSLLGSI